MIPLQKMQTFNIFLIINSLNKKIINYFGEQKKIMSSLLTDKQFFQWNSNLKKNLTTLLNSQYINSQLYIRASDFIQDAMFISFMQTSKAVDRIFRVLQQNYPFSSQKTWLTLFFIHSIMEFTISQKYSKQTINLLTKEVQKIQKLLDKNQRKQSEQKSSLIDKSIQKLKRTFSLSTKKSQKNLKANQNKQSSKHLLNTILIQYSDYLLKILTDIQLYEAHQISPKTKKYEKIIQKNPAKFKSIVWKIINLFKKLQKMTPKFQQIKRFFPINNKYIFSLINFIVGDIQILYHPIVEFIEYRRQEIIKIYSQEIFPLRLQHKDKYKEKVVELGKDQNFKQYKLMLQEFSKVNQLLLYIFGGFGHHKNIVIQGISVKVLSTNNPKFDSLYQLYQVVQTQSKKHLSEQQGLKNQKNVFVNKMNSTMKVVKYKSAKISQLKQVQQIQKKNIIQQTKETQRFSNTNQSARVNKIFRN